MKPQDMKRIALSTTTTLFLVNLLFLIKDIFITGSLGNAYFETAVLAYCVWSLLGQNVSWSYSYEDQG